VKEEYAEEESDRRTQVLEEAEDVQWQEVRAVFALFAGVVGIFRPPVFCVFHGDLVGLYDGSMIAHGHECDAQKAHQAGETLASPMEMRSFIPLK